MKYPYTYMLGLSFCAVLLAVPFQDAVAKKPAQAALAEQEVPGKQENPQETTAIAEEPPVSEEVTEEPPISEEVTERETGEEEEASEKEIPREHYFDDALFIGDSRTTGLFEYADMGAADVFADSGMSLYKVMEARLTVGSLGEKTLQELLAEKQYGKIYLMLGINELGYDQERTAVKYRELVQYLKQMQPQADIILETNMHVSKKKSDADSIYNNANIDAFNSRIREIASEEGLTCIDVNERFDDGEGNLAEEYTADDAHLLGKYYAEWADWIYENR